ncbi:MAG: hypothetical protein A2X25_10265 [Chloroflexi bacterium GWB2_49_20]|nr:MAG: hypothetical protein A2X25_10265 [Chloroflexi bacterium GWB2_49_20]OGN79199.1 MAG: hypothetical protein A2X26_03755 [Chloroflexi bacterium GWC2_49_37]OGN83031.1 MAG: hypothetical protein A2X27_08940 [Chloroflexi bacterium GWD2_49_16]HCC78692.1 hypothetical protein [Anaerolineae bacterium]
MTHADRAEIYTLLAELLAEPPDWMTSSGSDWPLFGLLTGLAEEADGARNHADALVGIPSESLNKRRERYTNLFASGRPCFWLYESAAKTGKILGPMTFEMAQLLQSVGLEVAGAELPDHISLELAFLAYLAGQVKDLSYEQQFLKKHGDWMIDLGRALQQTSDPVYAPIGVLMADWLTEQMLPGLSKKQNARFDLLVPGIPDPNECTLCGFCSQVCPTHALKVIEDAENTLLSLNSAECIHCSKCERICEFHALKMDRPMSETGKAVVLRQSSHVKCQTCGRAVASQAEMDYIVSKIGEATWQHLCLDCRNGLYI